MKKISKFVLVRIVFFQFYKILIISFVNSQKPVLIECDYVKTSLCAKKSF